MGFEKVVKAHWFDVVTPQAFGIPTFDAVMILTMALVMTFDLNWRQRCGAMGGLRKMGRRPCSGPPA